MSFVKPQSERSAWLIDRTQKVERLSQIVTMVAQYDDAADRTSDEENKAYTHGMAEGLRLSFEVFSR